MKIRNAMMMAAAIGCLTLTSVPVLAADFGREPVIAEPEEVRVEEGVTVAGVDVSGMTEEEARAAVTESLKGLAVSKFTVNVDGESVSMSWGLMGLTWKMEDAMDQAMVAGKGAGWVGKYKAESDLKSGDGTIEVPMEIKESGVDMLLEDVALVEGAPQNASISREDGEFVITEHVNGRKVNKEATKEAILAAVEAGITADLTVDAVVEVAEPEIKAEDLAVIKDELGSCTTYVSGTSNRYNNVKVASGNINGKVLFPGESASASTMMKTRIPANGYKLATQYANGKNEQAYGGGVCQVSSTLYNALLKAELQIDERHPHSMLVSYLDPSKDAAIAEGYKDLIFTNNTENPIYIEAVCEDRELTFTVYGVEYRPANRTVKYVSSVSYKNYPADIIKYDPTMPIGSQVKEGDRHPSCKSSLIKIVYENDVEVSRETLHTDRYSSSAVTITYGSMGATPGIDFPEGEVPVAPVIPEVPVDPVNPTPETQAPTPETQAPTPETQAPETQAPETQAPETQAPETQAPEASGEQPAA